MNTPLIDRIALTIRLDSSPRYKGSVHDDAVARGMGYRAALVPGAFLYGHFSRVAVDRWGLPWIAGGSMGARFRRPVYNGDDVTITCTPMGSGGENGAIALSMIGQDGVVAAEGWIAPPSATPAPPLEAWPLLALHEDRPVIAPGAAPVGAHGGTAGALLTEADILESRAAFDETHPIYAQQGIAHPGLLMRRAMFEVYASFRWPGPVVLTACDARHLAPVMAGQRLETSSIIAETFERRGKHYVVTEELLRADGLPAAQFRRTQLYA